MSSQVQRFSAVLLGAFAVVSGISQTLVLEPPWLRWATFAVTLACAVGAVLFFRKARDADAAIKALHGLAPDQSGTTVSPAASEAEVREVWRMDVDNFVDHSVPVTMGVKWWRKYPDGLYVIRTNGQLLGYVSFWPLSANVFRQFVNGKRMETEITARGICPPDAEARETHWYIGSIALRARFRKQAGVKQLIDSSLTHWMSKLHPDARVSLCALAYSPEGERLLQRFGFRCFARADESAHELPVYVLETPVTDLREQLKGAMTPS